MTEKKKPAMKLADALSAIGALTVERDNLKAEVHSANERENHAANRANANAREAQALQRKIAGMSQHALATRVEELVDERNTAERKMKEAQAALLTEQNRLSSDRSRLRAEMDGERKELEATIKEQKELIERIREGRLNVHAAYDELREQHSARGRELGAVKGQLTQAKKTIAKLRANPPKRSKTTQPSPRAMQTALFIAQALDAFATQEGK